MFIKAWIDRASSLIWFRGKCRVPVPPHQNSTPTHCWGFETNETPATHDSLRLFTVQTQNSQHITVDSGDAEKQCLTRLNRGTRLPTDECTFIQMLHIINEAHNMAPYLSQTRGGVVDLDSWITHFRLTECVRDGVCPLMERCPTVHAAVNPGFNNVTCLTKWVKGDGPGACGWQDKQGSGNIHHASFYPPPKFSVLVCDW